MPIKYVVAISFEATLFSSMYQTHEQWFPEIISFAGVLLNLQSGQIESVFRTLVRPYYFDYLAESTMYKMRVTPEVYYRLPTLERVLYEFDNWLTLMCKQRNVRLPRSQRIRAYTDYMLLCTWSNMDLKFYLSIETKKKNIRLSEELKVWLDVQKAARKKFDYVPDHLQAAACALGSPTTPAPFNAFDDATTLALLVHKLKKRHVYLMDLEKS